MNFEILYSETSREQIRTLHPNIKPAVKSGLEAIKENPWQGKFLQRELAGYLSFRVNRFRIIYKINEKENNIEIHYIGHRRDVYDIFKYLIYLK